MRVREAMVEIDVLLEMADQLQSLMRSKMAFRSTIFRVKFFAILVVVEVVLNSSIENPQSLGDLLLSPTLCI